MGAQHGCTDAGNEAGVSSARKGTKAGGRKAACLFLGLKISGIGAEARRYWPDISQLVR